MRRASIADNIAPGTGYDIYLNTSPGNQFFGGLFSFTLIDPKGQVTPGPCQLLCEILAGFLFRRFLQMFGDFAKKFQAVTLKVFAKIILFFFEREFRCGGGKSQFQEGFEPHHLSPLPSSFNTKSRLNLNIVQVFCLLSKIRKSSEKNLSGRSRGRGRR